MLYKNKQNKNKNKKMLDNQVNTWYNKDKLRDRQADNNGSWKQADSIKTNLTYYKHENKPVMWRALTATYILHINSGSDVVIVPEKLKTTQK